METVSWVTFARWLAVLPGATIALMLSSFPLHLLLYQTLTASGIVQPYPESPERLLGPFVATLAFVWTGSWIAPNRNMETAIALFGLMLLLCGAALALALVGSLRPDLSYGLNLGGVPVAMGVAGAALGLHLVRRGEVETRKVGKGEPST